MPLATVYIDLCQVRLGLDYHVAASAVAVFSTLGSQPLPLPRQASWASRPPQPTVDVVTIGWGIAAFLT